MIWVHSSIYYTGMNPEIDTVYALCSVFTVDIQLLVEHTNIYALLQKLIFPHTGAELTRQQADISQWNRRPLIAQQMSVCVCVILNIVGSCHSD